MSSRHWLYVLALGGCLVASGTALSQDGDAQSAPPPTTTEQPQAKPAPTPTPPVGQQIAPQEKGLCDTAEQRWTDLCQQSRMATAAERQVNWTKWSVIATSIAIFFTAWAALAASKAAAAADRAVEISADTAKRQLRAYVAIRNATHKKIGADNLIDIALSNGGQTAAYNVAFSCARGFFDEVHNGIVADPSDGPMESKLSAIISPGEFTSIAIDAPELGTHAPFLNGRVAYFIWGNVSYKDIFSETRKFKFRLILRKGSVSSFATCDEGNDHSNN
jgi:hypothetical protein